MLYLVGVNAVPNFYYRCGKNERVIMYGEDIQDSAIVEQINKRDAAQIKESVRHIHQQC